MGISVELFCRHMVESGLFDRKQVRSLFSSMPQFKAKDSARDFAAALVNQKRLTAFQATHLYGGKSKRLVIGNYELLDKLGQGGMGVVYQARHRLMERVVALKVLPTAIAKNERALKRFQREVVAAARLVHPNIVTAHDAAEADGIWYLVMEYVDGWDLQTLVKESGPLPVDAALSYTLQAAKGLAFAHKNGVIHRDIKPANLLVNKQGIVQVLDMGLARLDESANAPGSAANAEITVQGTVMGTVDYMAPEQAVNTSHADERSDIYALGMTLHFLLTARPAYAGDTLMERVLAHREQPVPSLRDVCSKASASLDGVFQKMVAKTAGQRYATMNDVTVALEGVQQPDQGVLVDASPLFTAAPQDSALIRFLNATSTEGAVGTATSTADADETARSDAGMVTQPSLFGSVTTLSGSVLGVSKWFRGSLRLSPGWWVLIACVIGLAIYAVSGHRPDRGRSGEPAPRIDTGKVVSPPPVDDEEYRPEVTIDHAIEFDGGSGYVRVPGLDEMDVGDALTFEVRVTPTDRPSGNIVTRSGPKWFGLYLDDGRWAVVATRSGTPRLYRSRVSSTPGTTVHLAAVWRRDDDPLLFVDGQKVELRSTRFNRPGIPSGVFIGGMPLNETSFLAKLMDKEKSLLDNLKARFYFGGRMDEIRATRGALYSEDFQPEESLTATDETLLLYHCDSGTGNGLHDESGNALHGDMFGPTWVKK